MSKKALALAALLPIGVSLLAATPATAAPNDTPSKFTYNGAGWGHGVGMSQYGAYGMALEGYTSKQILEHYYKPAKVTNTSLYASKDIKVQVVTGQSTSTITPNNGSLRLKFSGKTITSTKPVTFAVSGSNVKVSVNGSTYTVAGTAGVVLEWQNTRYWNSGNQNTTISVPKANDGVGTNSYRHGNMSIKLLKSKLNIVNSVRLNDEYLYGIAEVPSSWPSATLQAQAVAARTYAMTNAGSIKGACDCNVYDEVASQKFTGWGKENEANGVIGKKWVAAVNATQTFKSGVPTSAQTVQYKSNLISAVYSSSTGGRTRDAKDVWGYSHDYLKSQDDHWALKPETKNANRAWNRSLTQAQVAKGYGLPDVQKITVKRAIDHTIASSTAISSKGKVSTLTGVQTRVLFNTPSRWVFGIAGDNEKLPSTDNYTITNTAANVKYKTSSNLNMRSGPSTVYGSVRVLPNNTEVVTTGKQSGSWLQVKSGTLTGWVSSSYLVKVSTPAPKPTPPKPVAPKPVAPKPVAPKPVAKTTKYVTTANLNVREKSSATSKSLGILKNKASVEVYSVTNGWAKVKYGNKTAYVSSSYVKKASTAPVKAPVKAPAKVNPPKTVKYLATVNVNVREKAVASSKRVGLLNAGKTVQVQSISKGWAKVTYNNKTAYISSSYLKKSSTASVSPPKVAGPKATVTKTSKTTANVHMRTGAGTSHKSIAIIKKNTKVSLTGKTSGKWKQVKVSGKTGWVSGSYLK